MEVTQTKSVGEVLDTFKIVTDVSRVQDFEIPLAIDWGVGPVTIPRRMRTKDVHYIMGWDGQVTKACWINRALGLLLNSQRPEMLKETKGKQLALALHHVDMEISQLIKRDLLTGRRGPGAMSLSQANENVPPDCILISERTYYSLCAANKGWSRVQDVMVVRYPNLGPETTKRLKLIVNGSPPQDEEQITPLNLGERLPQLSDLLDDEEEPDTEVEPINFVDCFYVHPDTLRDCFAGDGDGDLLYISRLTRGKPRFQPTDLVREPGDDSEDVWAQMWSKANRVQRIPLPEYLPRYMDSDGLIAQATYAAKMDFFCQVLKETPGPEAMKQAWMTVSPRALKRAEFVFDMRKGEHPKAEVLSMVQQLQASTNAIRRAQRDGVWFAKVVTTAQPVDVPGFVDSFTTLQQFANYISRNQIISLRDMEAK